MLQLCPRFEVNRVKELRRPVPRRGAGFFVEALRNISAQHSDIPSVHPMSEKSIRTSTGGPQWVARNNPPRSFVIT